MKIFHVFEELYGLLVFLGARKSKKKCYLLFLKIFSLNLFNFASLKPKLRSGIEVFETTTLVR
jgi:hypothetical protein